MLLENLLQQIYFQQIPSFDSRASIILFIASIACNFFTIISSRELHEIIGFHVNSDDHIPEI